MNRKHLMWFLVVLVGASVGAFAFEHVPRSVIVGEPKQPIDNALYVRLLVPTRVELKSIRFL